MSQKLQTNRSCCAPSSAECAWTPVAAQAATHVRLVGTSWRSMICNIPLGQDRHVPGGHAESLGMDRHMLGGYVERHEPGVHDERNCWSWRAALHERRRSRTSRRRWRVTTPCWRLVCAQVPLAPHHHGTGDNHAMCGLVLRTGLMHETNMGLLEHISDAVPFQVDPGDSHR